VTLPEIGDGLPEVVVRTAIVYLFLVVAMRLSGKRQVGQMKDMIGVMRLAKLPQGGVRPALIARRKDDPRALLRQADCGHFPDACGRTAYDDSPATQNKRLPFLTNGSLIHQSGSGSRQT